MMIVRQFEEISLYDRYERDRPGPIMFFEVEQSPFLSRLRRDRTQRNCLLIEASAMIDDQ